MAIQHLPAMQSDVNPAFRYFGQHNLDVTTA
jgi:hypothetical protein